MYEKYRKKYDTLLGPYLDQYIFSSILYVTFIIKFRAFWKRKKKKNLRIESMSKII